jgi:hypothetical protein
MVIEELLNSDKISLKCFTFCERNGLTETYKILDHYRSNQSFKGIKYCPNNIDEELSDFCLNHYIEKGQNFLETINEIDKNVLTLNSLLHSGLVSVRSFNVCNSQGLNDIYSILKFFLKHKTFNKLKNCGNKSDKELTLLCIEYIEQQNFNFAQPNQPKKSIINLISNLSRTQREIINSYIEIAIKKLSNKSNKSIRAYLENNLTIRNITDKIFNNENFSFINVNNIGSKTTEELNKFIDSIVEFISKVFVLEDESQLIALKNRIFIEKTFSNSDIPDEIFETKSLFSLVDFLIKNEAIYQKNENLIFQVSLKIFINQPVISLEEIAENNNLSKERTRQIRKSCLEELYEKFQFIRDIDDDLHQKYDIDINQKIIIIDENICNKINQLNKTNFSKEFISFLIYSYYSDKFELVGKLEDLLVIKTFNTRFRHNWNNFYLVQRNICNLFDFYKLADDIYQRKNSRIEETYSFNFKSYLSNFLDNKDSFQFLEFSYIPELLINEEFDLIIDINDNIVFERNTNKQVWEYAIEALEKLGVPSKLEEIYILIEKENPEITKSQEALRGSLQRTKELIYFGRSSTYGLKKWEIEKDGIKGGTIKDLIIDFLREKSEPIHISKILEHLKKFRGDRDERSVVTNLKVDPEKRFLILNQGFIGLQESSHKYSDKYAKLPVQLGKTIIAKYERGHSKANLIAYLISEFNLTVEESNLIINNLKYFNETK